MARGGAGGLCSISNSLTRLSLVNSQRSVNVPQRHVFSVVIASRFGARRDRAIFARVEQAIRCSGAAVEVESIETCLSRSIVTKVASRTSVQDVLWQFQTGDVDRYLRINARRMTLAGAILGVGIGHLISTGDAAAITSSANENVALHQDMGALALGPEGPLLEDFWDNVGRYGLYFITVATGGIYSLVKPAIDLLRNPVTALLTAVVIGGILYLMYLTVSAMLGFSDFKYDYA